MYVIQNLFICNTIRPKKVFLIIKYRLKSHLFLVSVSCVFTSNVKDIESVHVV